MEREKEKIARENLLRDSGECEGASVKGYDFDEGTDYGKILKSFETSGAQASEFGKAVRVVNEMIKEKAFIFLGYTSNMISSGNREVIKWLVKNKKVDVIVTTAGGIEEDIIKCLGDFYVGDFKASGKELRDKGINRIGNIFVPNKRYVDFEKFVQPILDELYLEQVNSGKGVTSSEIAWKLGEKINDERSVYYWAWKNKLPVYCPAITDGALGDNVYFFKFRRQNFVIDAAEDVKKFNDLSFGLKKSGVIVLGGGVVKHAILNANMLRNGTDYAVYINTAQEYDASDSGASPEEAVSWGKIKKDARSVKVYGDAVVLFPLLVAESFAKD